MELQLFSIDQNNRNIIQSLKSITMRTSFSTSLNNALPIIFLLIGIGFSICVVFFANANTETLISHQTVGATNTTVPIDETTNGAYYGQGVYGSALIAATCFICAAITSYKRQTGVNSTSKLV